MLLIKNTVPYKRIISIEYGIENVIIELPNKIKLISVYNKPSYNFNNNQLKKQTDHNKCVIIGDLNAKHEMWNCNRSNTNGRTLKSFAENNNIDINYPSKHYPPNGMTPTTLDLALTKHITISKPIASTELNSDHNPVIFNLNNQLKEPRIIKITSYKNTDWIAFRKELDQKIKIDPNITSIHKLNTEINTYTNTLQLLKRKYTTNKTIDTSKDHLPDEIVNSIKTRSRTRETAQRHNDRQLYESVKVLTKEIQNKINTHRNNRFQNLLKTLSITDNSIWKMTKKLKNSHTDIATLTSANKEALTNQDKAELLAQHYENVFILDTNPNTPHHSKVLNTNNPFITYHSSTSQYNPNHLTNPTLLKQIIKKLPNNKAPGPEEISNKIIKNLSKKSIVQHTYYKLNHKIKTFFKLI